MRCPYCGNYDTSVKDSRPALDGVATKRKRFCTECNNKFATIEKAYTKDLVVIKSNGSRQEFDKDKVSRSIRIALRKRVYDPKDIDHMLNKILRQLEERPEIEISTKAIGEMVLQQLKSFDQVAYIRFASVYKDFNEITDFIKIIKEICEDPLLKTSPYCNILVSAGKNEH